VFAEFPAHEFPQLKPREPFADTDNRFPCRWHRRQTDFLRLYMAGRRIIGRVQPDVSAPIAGLFVMLLCHERAVGVTMDDLVFPRAVFQFAEQIAEFVEFKAAIKVEEFDRVNVRLP